MGMSIRFVVINGVQLFKNLGTNIWKTISWSFENAGKIFDNFVHNSKVGVGKIGDFFHAMFYDVVKGFEDMLNSATNGINSFTGWIADKTGAEFIRTNLKGITLTN